MIQVHRVLVLATRSNSDCQKSEEGNREGFIGVGVPGADQAMPEGYIG